MRLRLLLAACIIALPGTVSAQASGGSGAGDVRSTRSGVYTAEQAVKGGEIYALACANCHTLASHVGPVFAARWDGHPLSDLLRYITEAMPKQDPGSLATQEYTLVTAYLLKMNGMPPGREDLSNDLGALQKIRIELKATRDSSRR